MKATSVSSSDGVNCRNFRQRRSSRIRNAGDGFLTFSNKRESYFKRCSRPFANAQGRVVPCHLLPRRSEYHRASSRLGFELRQLGGKNLYSLLELLELTDLCL